MKAVYCFCASFLLISLWHQTSARTQKARSSSLESKVWDGFPNDLTFPPVQPTLPLWALLFLASVYPYLQRSLWLWSPALGSFRKMKSLKILALSRCKLYYAVVCLGGIYRNLIIHMNDFSPCKNPGISTTAVFSWSWCTSQGFGLKTAEGWRCCPCSLLETF